MISRDEFEPLIRVGLSQQGVALSDTQIAQMAYYLSILSEWNQAINLTAITTAEAMVSKHILDSLSLMPFVQASPVLDVGTGAGLPGIPLSIAMPQHEFVLLDKLSKRIQFLHHVKHMLKLENVSLTCERVESLRGFDFPCIVSRAFASIDKLVKVCSNCLQDQGRILAMTGPLDRVVLESMPAGWVVCEPKKLTVPGIERPHYVVIVEKETR